MNWPFGSRPRAATTEPPQPRGHHSLGLKALFEGLNPESRHAVLDLGAAVGANIERLSSWSCSVRVADLYASLCAEPIESREPEAFGALLERLLPLGDERYDIVLAWDLFNYLRLDQVGSLMGRLAPACQARAVVLALMWTQPQVPALPLRYRIVDLENLAYDGLMERVRPCLRHSQHDLGRVMPGFAVKGSFLLRAGIQEYLFEPRPGPKAR